MAAGELYLTVDVPPAAPAPTSGNVLVEDELAAFVAGTAITGATLFATVTTTELTAEVPGHYATTPVGHLDPSAPGRILTA